MQFCVLRSFIIFTKYKRETITNVSKNVENLEYLYIADRIAKWSSHFEKLFLRSDHMT